MLVGKLEWDAEGDPASVGASHPLISIAKFDWESFQTVNRIRT